MTFNDELLAAIAAGVCRITGGGLGKLNKPEKQRLLEELRERDDCPEGWTNTDPKKQTNIINGLHNAIA